MDRKEFEAVLEEAAKQRDCEVVDLKFDDDDNVFEVTLDKHEGFVDLADCELSWHRFEDRRRYIENNKRIRIRWKKNR